MYTRCPHCLTLFVVGADQLKAAHGNVRCGTCLESFDAIPYLSDGAPEPAGAEPAGEAPPTAPEFDTRSASARLSSTLVALGAAAATTGPAERRALEPDPLDAAADEPHRADDHPGDVEDGSREAEVLPEDDIDHELPEILREQGEEQSARSAARKRNVGYGAAAASLLALLAFQYVFFMPDDAARRYPQWRGAIESMCERIGCVLPERRDPSRIRVLSRDVRLHPKFEGVLQIKATLANAAPFRQPYPRVRFTLFNVNGQTIATRVFQPSEYLGRAVSPSARVRPRTPFQIALDVLAPEEAAVSFEFQFL